MHHKLEVCGLKWSRDGSYLAAGSNDNSATVWTFEQFEQPLHELQHSAAVKGLAWCPWRSSILATGAGSADCHLRLWNVRSGTCEQQVETGSQVCSVVVNNHNQIITQSVLSLCLWIHIQCCLQSSLPCVRWVPSSTPKSTRKLSLAMVHQAASSAYGVPIHWRSWQNLKVTRGGCSRWHTVLAEI